MKKFALLLLVLCAAFLPVGVFAVPGWAETVTYYVTQDGSGDGLSKANPTTFKNAINNIYYTDNDGNIEIMGDITLTEGVTIGGRPYTINGNNHTLTTNGGGRVITVNGGTVNIDNLTITGGGIEAGSCYLNVTNCIFSNNTATDNNGGGIYAKGNCDLSVENCRFEENSALNGDGGGIYCESGATASIKRCTFYSNTASGNGGGVYVYYKPGNTGNTIENCTFYTNAASSGKGVYVCGSDNGKSININYCTFVSGTGNKNSEVEYSSNNTGLNSITIKNSIIYGSVDDSVSLDKDTCLILNANTTLTSKDVEVTSGDVTIKHRVFCVEDNSALAPAVGKGTATDAPEKDQLDGDRKNPYTLGAVDFDGKMTFTVTATKGLTAGTTDGTFSGYVGQAVTLSPDVTPAGLASGAEWRISGTLPDGLKLDTEKGVISGKLKEDIKTAKDYTFTLIAQNIDYSAEKKLTVTINPITLKADKDTGTAKVGDSFGDSGKTVATFTPTPAANNLPDNVTYSWNVTVTPPTGATASDVTASVTGGVLKLKGSPSVNGDYKFKVTATAKIDNVDCKSNEAVFTLTVSETEATVEPKDENFKGFNGNVGVELKDASVDFKATPALSNYQWTVTPTEVSGVKASMSDSTLTLSGAPTEKSTDESKYTFTVKADTGDGSASGTATVTLKVGDPILKALSVDITGEKDLVFTQGVGGSQELTAKVMGIYTAGDPQNITDDCTLTWSTTNTYGVTIQNNNKLTIPATLTAGEYTVPVMVEAQHGGVSPATARADFAITVTTPDTPAKTDYNVTPPTANALTYNGQAQELVSAGKVNTSDTAAKMKYSLSENGTYAEAIPTETEEGKYTVYWKVEADATHNEAKGSVQAEIKAQSPAKTDPTVTRAPVGNNLTYTGSPQALVTAGGATGGTMMYSLNKDSGYTKNIPTGTEVKTYTVWWYVKGDETHNDTAKSSVTATINSKPDEHTTADITGVKLSITTDTPVVTLDPGQTKKLNFTATAEITYKNGDKKTEPARIKTWWRGDGAWPDWMKIHSSFNANPNTVDLTPGKDVGGTTMTCRVAAETESYNGHTDWAECEFTVTVQASETFTPKNLFFEKPRIEMTVEPGNTVEDSCKVRLQLYGSKGTVKESTDGYTLVCRKANDSGASWVTSSVDGWTITFKSAPPADWHWSDSTIFVINAMDKDGKQYLSTSYLVVSYVSNVKSYQLTAAPTEVTVLTGKKDSVDLKKSVRFEKVYENGKRVLLDGAKLTFSPRTSDRVAPWMDLNSDGVVTLAPGADVEPGRYFCDYRAAANDNGRTGTSEGTLIVNVVNTGAPKITTETLPDVEVGTTYSAQMTAEGLSPISWDIVSGALPEGLSFDEMTGKLSGTPTLVKDYTFDVQARNSAGDDHRVFNLKVRDQKPSGWCWTKSKKATKSGSTGKWHAIFHVKNGTNVNYYNKSTTRDNLDKDHLKKVTKTNGARAGEGNIKYDLLWPKTNNKWEEYTYKFKVQAGNNAGTSTYEKSFTAAKTTGKLSVAGVSLAADDIILTDEDDGVETFEPYDDGKATEADGQDEGVTYYANGGVDEEGHLSVVIGKAAEGVEEGKEYVFESIAKIPADSLDKVVSVEFRGATVDSLGSLPNLEDLAIDNGSLGNLDLNGRTKLKSVSLYGCKELKRLVVNGCSSLESLSVMKCPKLSNLGVTGCGALENVDVMGAAITELDLSKRSGLATLNLNDCGKLATLNVAGCSALTDVSLNSTDITALDLSACAGLSSLSLADAAALTDLTLPSGASFDSFTLTGSRVLSLTLKGTEKLTMLDLSGNAGLTTLALSGCSALSELDVSGCGFEILDLSGCTSLEKLNASECAAMTTLTLPVSSAQDVSVSDSATAGKLKELSVGGCAELRSLNVSGQSLGHLELDGLKWLTRVQCDGQFIGGRTMSENMDLKDYAGNCLYRVSDVQGYAADGSPVETSWNKDTGAVTFASVPESLSYAYDTGLYGYVLGVTVSTSSDPADGPDSPTSNRGGGGCDAGLGVLALSAVGLLSVKRRK